MRLTKAIVTTFVLGFAACSGDDGSPPPIDSPVVDASPDDAPDAPPGVCGTGGTVGFLDTCTSGADCGASCTCETFHPVMRCTKTCTSNADCPAPSAGCLTTTGFCRP